MRENPTISADISPFDALSTNLNSHLLLCSNTSDFNIT